VSFGQEDLLACIGGQEDIPGKAVGLTLAVTVPVADLQEGDHVLLIPEWVCRGQVFSEEYSVMRVVVAKAYHRALGLLHLPSFVQCCLGGV